MCGIFGALRVAAPGEETPSVAELGGELARGLRTIAHRGPDGDGLWTTGSASESASTDGPPFALALGHRRLAIFDLSDDGRQPMHGSAGDVVVFNGEIYNFRELRVELEGHGHVFRTGTDTEVLLASYRQWGESCVERFIGMWAFALWDGAALVLSRDRLGQKPLYYVHDPAAGLFAFASEIEPLLALDGVARRADERTVYRYLAFAEMEREGRTFFDGVRELAPASILRLAPSDVRGPGEFAPRRYWSLPDGELEISEDAAATRVEELLLRSVELRLRSDAALGLSLSGGLDSTLLLALANELGERNLPVFSTGYDEPGYNENDYLEIACRELSCAPHRAPSDSAAFHKDFTAFLRRLGQPSRLPGPFSQWRVARRATGEVKVLLDGQGADELFGGYVYFLPAAWREASWPERLRGAPDLARTALANRHVLRQYPAVRILERLRGRPAAAPRLPLDPEWAARFADERPAWAGRETLQDALRRSLLDTSLPPLLRYGDRTSMAWGIENRCPFLDHRLVETVVALPVRLKIRGGTTKYLLRRVAEGRVPEEIVRRRGKMGFPTPFGEWLRGALADWARRRIDAVEPGGWLYRSAVSGMLEEHVRRAGDHQAFLWRALSLQAWREIVR